MKILLYGGNGWIGSQIIQLLKNLADTTFITGNSRVDDIPNLNQEIEERNKM